MALALNNSQNSDNNEPNQYCTEFYSKMSVAHELVKNNLTTIAQTRSKTIDIPFYFKLKDEVFLFSPVLSKKTHLILERSIHNC